MVGAPVRRLRTPDAASTSSSGSPSREAQDAELGSRHVVPGGQVGQATTPVRRRRSMARSVERVACGSRCAPILCWADRVRLGGAKWQAARWRWSGVGSTAAADLAVRKRPGARWDSACGSDSPAGDDAGRPPRAPRPRRSPVRSWRRGWRPAGRGCRGAAASARTSAAVPNSTMRPEVHDRDVAGHVAHHGQVVGDEQDRQAQLALQLADQVEHGALDRDVQGGGDLVGDEHLRGGRPGRAPARPVGAARPRAAPDRPASASGRGGPARAGAPPPRRRSDRLMPGGSASSMDSPMVIRGSREE